METDSKKLDLLKKFIDMMGLRNFSEATIRQYSYHLEKFIEFKKDRHVSILSSQDFNDYLLHLVSQGAGTSTMNQAINGIKFFFTYALNRKVKAYLVVRPKKEKTNPILLSDQELESLFRVCENKKHRAVICILFGAGLRVSEVIGLKLTSIDEACMLIHVKAGKGKKDRSVMLDVNVQNAIKEYIAEYDPKEYLFNGQNNSPQYSVSSIQQFVKAYAIKAGITKKVHPHLFRHGFITGILENGGDIYDAQLMAGHEDPRTTANVYAHLSPKYIASIKSPIANINLLTMSKGG